MSGDVSKLPVWAQRKIEVLERNVEYWKGKAEVVEGEVDSPVTQDYGMRGEGVRNLDPEAEVRFQVGDGHWDKISVRLERNTQDEIVGLYIMGHHDDLLVIPQASNVVKLRLGRD